MIDGKGLGTPILIAVVVLGTSMIVCHAIDDLRQQNDSDPPTARAEMPARHASDVTFLKLRDSARRHMTAVRTSSAERPDEDMAHDLIAYGQAAMTTSPRDGPGPVPALADLRVAMDGLRPLDAPRVDCPARAKIEDPRCVRYFEALRDVFGRDF